MSGRDARLTSHLNDTGNLGLGSLDIALARKAREHAHGQHHVELRDVRLDELDIVIGLHGDGGLAAGVVNHIDCQIKLAGIGVERLGMHRNDVGRMLQIPGKLFERLEIIKCTSSGSFAIFFKRRQTARRA